MITVTNQQLISPFWRNLNERPEDWKSMRYFSLPVLKGKAIQHGCAYQSGEDPTLGCAIGQALIDLGLMNESIANCYGGVHVLITKPDLPFTFENFEFAQRLQYCHDAQLSSFKSVVSRKDSVCRLAEEYGLILEDYDS